MAEEIDRKYLPELVQKTFCISLGACYKSVEMMKTPQESATKMFGEVKEILTDSRNAVANPPKEGADGWRERAEVLAGVWAGKGMDLMQTWQEAGEKFTDAK
jgi:hypothetical protein